MIKKDIVIVGGSVAGCALGALLQRLDVDFVILERSTNFKNQGAGISLSESLIDQCIALDLFDEDISRIPLKVRHFIRKDNNGEEAIFWTQPINSRAVEWSSVYRNLRKRVKEKYYCAKTQALAIKHTDNEFVIETSKDSYQTQFIIGADGINSFVRSQLLPSSRLNYAGYIAWRGLLKETYLENKDLFKEEVNYYFYPGGHLILYKIPTENYQATGEVLLNWVIYESPEKPLNDLLIDKNGKKHAQSLPLGSLSDAQIAYIRAFANKVLPKSIATLINKTAEPFIQAVFDFQLPAYTTNKVIFVGDAAVTLRPHSGSGVLKALGDAIKIYNLLQDNQSKNLSSTMIAEWKKYQASVIAEETVKSRLMGEALVANPPNWSIMTHETTEQWWNKLMAGKNWYATSK
ncbi:hypothetical protein ACNVED_04380 [Legionella sp. D16C41]|uniref:FAD binding domain-containing protein n=1 Tax=Legionella sp. D16C41 TaxID=3402688 RepID=UPI003AF5EE86